METIYIDEIKHLYPCACDEAASTATIYNCIIDGESYIFKKFDDVFDDEHADKLDSLSRIKSKYIIQPKILVKNRDNYNEGYLAKTFNNSNNIDTLSNNEYDINKKIKVLKITKNAILEMHYLGVIHTDLHTGNILFCNNSVKICDFDGCKYLSFEPNGYNDYSQEYIIKNGLSPAVDIYNFNLGVASILYNISWYETLECSWLFEDKLNSEQKRIWQKVKTQEPLTNKDFLINHY